MTNPPLCNAYWQALDHAVDTDGFVDYHHAYDYYQIAEIYKQTRKYNEALDWAERGVAAFPERTDTRLRELLATEYHRRGKHKEAMEVVWRNFVDWPGLL